MTLPALFDAGEVRRALAMILFPGQVTELRALDATLRGDRWPGTVFGFFDDTDKLVNALEEIQSARGIYFTPNPLNPALLARCCNRVRRAGKGDSASDGDVIRRYWLLVDCDPVRPANISSTDAEHDAALSRAREIDCDLWERKRDWPKPIFADSGNGGHLLYPFDRPADDGGRVQRILAALAAAHSDETVKVDTTVYNPARIWKLPGTLTCKGDNMPDRPHRMARILWWAMGGRDE